MKEVNSLPVKAKQGGYTIVELSIALTVIAILIVGGLSGVSALLTSSKANGQIEDSGKALTKLQSILTSTSVSGLTTSSGIGMGLFPANRIVGNTITNVLGGKEYVNSNSSALGTTAGISTELAANGAAIYTLTGIPKAVCTDVAGPLASLAAAAYVYNATAADSGATTNLVPGNLIKSPGGTVQGTAMGTQCNLASTLSMSFVLQP
jgi:prepilin-type N-terminal cleavage/methylation domain-containing protein